MEMAKQVCTNEKEHCMSFRTQHSSAVSSVGTGMTSTVAELCHRKYSITDASYDERKCLLISDYFRWKPALDRTLALLLFLVCLPLMAIVYCLVKLTSKGPAIFRQKRLGKDGDVFTMYKFRSMKVDCEKKTGAVWSVDGDPRTTLVGAFLRKFHLDELPQLWNVLRGEMSLVGPRPERPEFLPLLNDEVCGYSERMSVRPGITGLAQLNLPPDQVIEDVRRKLVLDFVYIENASIGFDFRILLGTSLRFAKFAGHLPLRLIGIRYEYDQSHWAPVICHQKPSVTADESPVDYYPAQPGSTVAQPIRCNPMD